MKKIIIFTTTICAVACAALSVGSVTAFADSGEETADGLDIYPQSFSRNAEFGNLTDYEIDGSKMLFLDGDTAYEYSGERLTALDTLPAFDNYGEKDEFPLGDYYYYVHGDDVKVLDKQSEDGEITTHVGFFNLKLYGSTAYAICDNVLYELSGKDCTAVELPYLDFSSTENILTGNVEESLRQLSSASPSFVSLKTGAFMTEVNMDRLGGTHFSVGETMRVGTEITAKTALLLARTGADDGISLVMLCDGADSKCYLISAENATVEEREALRQKELGATVTVDGAFVYTAPYVCDATKLAPIQSGDPLKVVGEITKEDNPELVRDFYKVEYETENGTVTGYVPLGYVSPFTYIENDPVVTEDPDYSQDDPVKEVLLVIVVIVLVLAAGGYIVYTITAGKTKNKNKEK